MMTIIDPEFPIPTNKAIKKEIYIHYINAFTKLNNLLENTCESASLTVDLWTAKSKHGYIGITLHWLSDDFKIFNCLLGMERMTYPHSGEKISMCLRKKVYEFGLDGRITCVVVTDKFSKKNFSTFF